ncbi:hypothetical protein T4D_17029 [Trichinella pseudospiralis]|uniref:Uncharacterized protein n=1 Tax=Trichinella pseudospiralis TaxID=6337 RepID=A0A0V1FZE8_TRIPS|nr:hypothetical protein T4D_17029 [Trichinella pseudospiralis]
MPDLPGKDLSTRIDNLRFYKRCLPAFSSERFPEETRMAWGIYVRWHICSGRRQECSGCLFRWWTDRQEERFETARRRTRSSTDALNPQVPPSSDSRICYLPHQAEKRYRVLFDQLTWYDHTSLNRQPEVRLNLQIDLFKALLWFRKLRVGLQADIQMMYLKVRIARQDRDAYCLLWKGLFVEIGHYRLTRVCFGLTCLPLLTINTVRVHARRHQDAAPRAATAENVDIHHKTRKRRRHCFWERTAPGVTKESVVPGNVQKRVVLDEKWQKRKLEVTGQTTIGDQFLKKNGTVPDKTPSLFIERRASNEPDELDIASWTIKDLPAPGATSGRRSVSSGTDGTIRCPFHCQW